MFASYFLAPYEALAHFVRVKLGKERYALELIDVIKIEQYYGFSRQAMLWRLINDGYLSRRKANTMKTGIISSALRLGFDDKLYLPAAVEKRYVTLGKYVRMAEELKDKGLISTGKYEELLLDGFRSDIVYGFTIQEEETYD